MHIKIVDPTAIYSFKESFETSDVPMVGDQIEGVYRTFVVESRQWHLKRDHTLREVVLICKEVGQHAPG